MRHLTHLKQLLKRRGSKMTEAFVEIININLNVREQIMGGEPGPEAYVFVATSGESQRGAPGVVYVDAEEGRCVYLLMHEVEPQKLREGLEEMISRDNGENYFIVHKASLNVHVFQYPRKKAHAEIASGSIKSPVANEAEFSVRSPPSLME